MDDWFATLLARYQVSDADQDALRDMMEQVIERSLRAGRSVLGETTLGSWRDVAPGDTVVPMSPREAEAEGDLPNLAKKADASKRYEQLGCLGVGSMGEVYRVQDKHLKRKVAMKVLRPELVNDFELLARFIEEAQATAQLQHPGIIPLHDLGQFEDGRYYFTMKEIRGTTLAEAVEELHNHSRYMGRWSKSHSGWTFRRLVEAFRDVCRAVAYAHQRGVLHRDLKPENVMLGAYGEVLVLDWGLAKVKEAVGQPQMGEGLVETDRAKQQKYATKVGVLTGTPMYMSPEQARGDALDARSDVYGLGAVLYEILSGRPPFVADSLMEVMELLLSSSPMPLIMSQEELQKIWATNPYFRPPLPVPETIAVLCEKAMARDPQERFASADELAEAMEQWLEGDLKREQAEKLFGEAQAQRTEADSLRQQAEAKLAQATQLEAQVAPWEDASKKADIWRLQDEADELLLDAERKSQESELRLQEALVYEPQLHEARVALAEMCQRFHAEAEQAGRDVERVRVEQRLLRQVRALPASHARHGELSAYLKGDGTLTLLTEPTGAEVEIYEFAEDNRRLSAVNGRSLGLTPLMEVPVPKGSHILRIMLAGHDEVRLPISISRGEAWSMTPPGATTPVTLPLLRQGMLGQDERYVAPGWFLSGGSGDVAANSLPERRMWCDGFVLQRFPVTIGQYTAFLNTLWQEGKRDEAMRYVPRLSKEGDPLDSMVFFMRPSARGFMLDGSRLPPQANDLPVTYVDVLSAQAYARWYSGLTGHVWKLPDELTWEKAARGVDGRLFPWGNWMDPSWCCMIDSHPERPTLDIVTQWPVDKSPFGMRGAAGGVGDWCDNPFRVDGPATGETAAQPEQPGDRHSHARSNRPLDEHSIVAVRGGAWNEGASYTCCASRYGALAMGHFDNIGFRLVRWL